ncbi:MAG TPA: tRNA preQ1(34) S-adenosylmethionine ribosyltransferase-isomerase QueA [Pseudogracilibacillus sp.]|nr:tRNA preQ1(34) S-adenosylmethionine ribosyltransferase-isomerase QueA [Pseudogracilibacillus sp.]
MNLEAFDYVLPEHLIAQTPLQKREASKLFVIDEQNDTKTHTTFTEIERYLRRGDCLVINDSRVIPVRLFGTKVDTGANIEVLFLHEVRKDEWTALVKPAKRVKVGSKVSFGDETLVATCTAEKEKGERTFTLQYDGRLLEVLERIGEMPLPPYIKSTLTDKERYQTVYAKESGSAAAPTAGLHFTEKLLDRLRKKGVRIVPVTLHVGLGTFRPLDVTRIEDHTMHAEYFHITEESVQILNDAKRHNERIIAVGTTSVRVLESIFNREQNKFVATSGWTDIYIYPPYSFRAIDGLVTNFHLPKSSLLVLVSAFIGREKILGAYAEAIERSYRFFSFGDAMFILQKKE